MRTKKDVLGTNILVLELPIMVTPECLTYAHENGCPWDEKTCSCAALGGQLECLKYAHENRCPRDEMTCSKAAAKGHLECLKYAHEQRFPLSWWTFVVLPQKVSSSV